MRSVFIFTFFIAILFSSAQGQVQFFKDLLLDNGSYSLYIINIREPELVYKTDSQSIESVKKVENFYTDDPNLLKEIRAGWTGKAGVETHECGYDFVIYLMKADSIILKMLVNLDCHELLLDNVGYAVDPEILTSVVPKCRGLDEVHMKFKDVTEGREAWQEVSADSNYVLLNVYRPRWINFDGEFEFDYYDDSEELNVSSVTKKLNAQLIELFPGSEFQIISARSSFDGRKYVIKLSSTRSMFDNFHIFQKTLWKEYDTFRIHLYRKIE